MSTSAEARSLREGLRRWLSIVTVFGILYHVDHVIRGNHSGWPIREVVTPFTFSLLIYVLLLPGLYLTARACSPAIVDPLSCPRRRRRPRNGGNSGSAGTGYTRYALS